MRPRNCSSAEIESCSYKALIYDNRPTSLFKSEFSIFTLNTHCIEFQYPLDNYFSYIISNLPNTLHTDFSPMREITLNEIISN